MFTFNRLSVIAASVAVAAGLFTTTSCIENDLPYPWVLPVFTSFDVESEDADGNPLLTAPVQIDSASRSVSVYLSEWADVENVNVLGWTLSDGSVCTNPEVLSSPLDLRNPVEPQLELYKRSFVWTITATQDIERYFTVASQIGTSEIDVENHTVHAMVPAGQPLDNITVRSLKLAGKRSSIAPDIVGAQVDFSSPVEVTVSEFGRETEWTITVTQTEVSVDIERVDAWTNVAWLYANAEEGKANGFEYREASADEWTNVPQDWITVSGGSFSARLIHLVPETRYVARAVSDGDYSAEVEFTTGSVVQLPNSNFENWWLNGKVWNPWSDGGESYWDTGNRGAATLGQSNTLPMEDAMSATGYQGAVLQTKFIGVSVLGKLAAGNLFAGSYVKTDGTNGILAFGREFTQRPTKLCGRIKYTNVPMTHASKTNPDFTAMIGEPDTCIVWCALGDWDQPYEIRTKPSDRQLFNPDDAGVIAYGQVQLGESTDDYIDITVDLKYKATDRVPKFILVTASASKYGDYFTGGNGSVLYLKSYRLEYDY